MQKTLILWDIDGTILNSNGSGMKALNTALTAVFGISGSFEGIDFAGRTDRMIVRQIFSRFGIEYSPKNMEDYFEGYAAVLPGTMASSKAEILPGVSEILARLSERPEVAHGLLTGNMRRGAQIKLGHHGLWEHFPIGAFADDSEIRNELGPHALKRAKGHWGVDFPLERVWIVGDTPHDVACARAFGARALAVATGLTGASDLAAHRPDAVLPDLVDAGAFWRAIGS
jgi:phosphoglycolate phosphatase